VGFKGVLKELIKKDGDDGKGLQMIDHPCIFHCKLLENSFFEAIPGVAQLN
jgi:hypothetical protein